MGGKGSGGPRGGGAPPRSPEFIARAVKLAADLGSPKEAAEQLTREGTKVSWRSIYNWQNGEKGARKPGVLPKPRKDTKLSGLGSRSTMIERAVMKVAGAKAPAVESPSPEPPPALVVAEKPPEGLTTRQARRWYIEKQIELSRNAIAQAHAIGQGHRTGNLETALRQWLGALAEIEGPEKEDPDAERRAWRAAADRVLERIRSGLAARIS